MNRREFLIRVGGTLVAVPFVLEATGCGDDGSPNPGGGTNSFTSRSSSSGHTHLITFTCTAITGAGGNFTSDADGTGHQHSITLTTPQLASIASGSSVGPVPSTVASGHSHTWTIQKPTGVC